MDDPTPRITITICGDGGCGKSSITLRLVRSQWTHEYDPTIEDSYTLTRRIDGTTYHLSITDTAGQEEYRGMWASSNLSSDAFLLVYDITSRASLEQLEYFDGLVQIECETREDAWRSGRSGTNGGGSGWDKERERGGFVKPIKIVAGNKCDLQAQRQVPAQLGLEWARNHGCGFMETSARNTVNIEETFALIVRRVVEARKAAALEGREGERQRERNRGGDGPRGAGGRDSDREFGTRRAVTAPLSPLPGGPEKEFADAAAAADNERRRNEKDGAGNKWTRFWSRLVCWR